MPRVTKHPVVYLALSKAAVATALGIRPDEVTEAVDAGLLIERRKGVKKRIAIFGPRGVQEWFESWPQSKKDRPR